MSNEKRNRNLRKSRPGDPENGKNLNAPLVTIEGDILVGKEKRAYSRTLKLRARQLLEDPEYIESLRLRLIAGEAGAMETWLARYGYGDPKPDTEEEELRKREFEKARQEVKQILREGRESGKVLPLRRRRSGLATLPMPGPLEGEGDGHG